jgi:hypothetical protein
MTLLGAPVKVNGGQQSASAERTPFRRPGQPSGPMASARGANMELIGEGLQDGLR